MDDKYKWLTQYAQPCFNKNKRTIEDLPHIETIRDFLGENYSREKVMDYFMAIHNPRTLGKKNYIHMVIPYEIKDIGKRVTGVLWEPFYENFPIPLCSISFENEKIEEAKEKGIIKGVELGDILLVHFLKIVDSCKKEDLKKYDYLYVKIGK